MEEKSTQCFLGYGFSVYERKTEGAELRSRPSSSPPRVTCQREAQPPGVAIATLTDLNTCIHLEKLHRLDRSVGSGKSQRSFLSNKFTL